MLGFMVIAAANLCHSWLVLKCSLCNHAPTISGEFITSNISSVVFQPVAVNVCCNYKHILASGAIVGDEQLQCLLQAVMPCYCMSQQVVQLWKMSNWSVNNLSPFPLAGNVKVQGSIGSYHHSSLHYHLLI